MMCEEVMIQIGVQSNLCKQSKKLRGGGGGGLGGGGMGSFCPSHPNARRSKRNFRRLRAHGAAEPLVLHLASGRISISTGGQPGKPPARFSSEKAGRRNQGNGKRGRRRSKIYDSFLVLPRESGQLMTRERSVEIVPGSLAHVKEKTLRWPRNGRETMAWCFSFGRPSKTSCASRQEIRE